ncbi:MAG: PHP domain-containing protein [Gemmataceae bacterium]
MKFVRSLAIALVVLGILSTAIAFQSPSQRAVQKPDGVIEPLRGSTVTYWKGNLHTHSFWSDGNDFPEMIADWYKRRGYNFLTMSDHNILSEGQRWINVSGNEVAMKKYLTRFGTTWVEQRTFGRNKQVRLKPLREFRHVLESPGKFLMIQGEEITHRFARSPVHLNGINLRDVVIPINGNSVAETIKVNQRAVEKQQKKTGRDMLVFLNHPNFGWGIQARDLVLAEDLKFFEVYNGHPGVRNDGDTDHPSTERMWDIALALRLGQYDLPILFGMATDDAHRYHKYGIGKVNPGRGWIMVKAPFLTAETIVRAIHRGDYFMSTGVTLKSVSRKGERLSIVIEEKPGVKYTTEFIATLRGTKLKPKPPKGKSLPPIYSKEIGKVVATVKGLTPAYEMTGKELYVRAKVVSSKPHPNPYKKGDMEVAWTQPFTP